MGAEALASEWGAPCPLWSLADTLPKPAFQAATGHWV